MSNSIKNHEKMIVVLGAIGSAITIIGFSISYATEMSTKIHITWISAVIIAIALWIYLIYYRIREQKKEIGILSERVSHNEKQINDLKGRPKTKFDRFETIKKEGILKYGFIQYKPFFWTVDTLDRKGIGKELLGAVFGRDIRLEPYQYPKGKNGGNWKDIFEDLCRKPNPKFDIIITPLFETRSRLYNFDIAFCSPIFYSNIGIYVRADYFDNHKRSFKDAIQYIKSQRWTPEVLSGELSELLVEKHFPEYHSAEKNDNKEPASDDDFIKVLRNVNNNNPADKRNNNLGDFAFMEIFKANSIMNQWGSSENFHLVNILKDNELMYPVSFVVRKEDTVLRNLINIRLMDLRESGELEKIIKSVAKEVHIVDEAEFNSIFIQKYNLDSLAV